MCPSEHLAFNITSWTLHNGLNVSVVLRRKSISVIDHPKCGPLFQGCNALSLSLTPSTSLSPRPAASSCQGFFGLFFPTLTSFLSHSRCLTFKVFFLPFPSLCFLSIPVFVSALRFSSSNPSSCSLAHHSPPAKKTSGLCQYPVTQWGGLGPDGKTKGAIKKKKNTTRQKRRELGRKAWHQEGFSFVQQEVWETKGRKEVLFQSVTPLIHCFHCALADVFGFTSGINELQMLICCADCWPRRLGLNVVPSFHWTVATICCERAPHQCPADDKLWNTPPSCLQTAQK